MCGIVGFWTKSRSNNTKSSLYHMAQAIHHRGPDDSGLWVDELSGLSLAHRRLSILDLSPSGHQPMESSCGRFVIVYNGEIYNHLLLREQLKKQGNNVYWQGHSDTETLLECFSSWGIKPTLQAIVGMFAFALWDKKEKVLILARDRMGEKPLYYGHNNNSFYFSSELKGLKAHPSFKPTIDRNSITLLFRHNCIPAPYSIYKNIYKLLPGHYATLYSCNDTPTVLPYWDLPSAIIDAKKLPLIDDDKYAIELLRENLTNSIKGQLQSDVPLGAFLSGGIDSSLIVALAQEVNETPIKTFTVGVPGTSDNEADYARAIAKHLKTEHIQLDVTHSDALDFVSNIPNVYCEPFSDSSQIPTYLICKRASQYVKVALSGDGGDELFCGYNRYLSAYNLWKKASRLPKISRHILATAIRTFPPQFYDKIVNCLLPPKNRITIPGYKAHKFANILAVNNEFEFYKNLCSHLKSPEDIVIGSYEPETLLTTKQYFTGTYSFVEWMMAMDTQTYLPDDILCKVDRAAMASSLETRAPFLDHRIVEYAWKLPLRMKTRNGVGKWLLRQLLYEYVPNQLIDRPKSGFGVPLSKWLRTDLRDWSESLLNETKIRNEGYLNVAATRKMWADHLSAKQDFGYELWDILMFQEWLNHNAQ